MLSIQSTSGNSNPQGNEKSVRVSNGFCMGGVSKGKINLVELSNVRVNGQSIYRMLTVFATFKPE